MDGQSAGHSQIVHLQIIYYLIIYEFINRLNHLLLIITKIQIYEKNVYFTQYCFNCCFEQL